MRSRLRDKKVTSLCRDIAGMQCTIPVAWSSCLHDRRRPSRTFQGSGTERALGAAEASGSDAYCGQESSAQPLRLRSSQNAPGALNVLQQMLGA